MPVLLGRRHGPQQRRRCGRDSARASAREHARRRSVGRITFWRRTEVSRKVAAITLDLVRARAESHLRIHTRSRAFQHTHKPCEHIAIFSVTHTQSPRASVSAVRAPPRPSSNVECMHRYDGDCGASGSGSQSCQHQLFSAARSQLHAAQRRWKAQRHDIWVLEQGGQHRYAQEEITCPL